jgi:acyl carrier protein
MQNQLPFAERFEQILRKHLRLVAPDEPIPFDASLVSIGLDSIGTINLLLDIEDAFTVSLPGALLTPQTFQNRATLQSAVAALVEGG